MGKFGRGMALLLGLALGGCSGAEVLNALATGSGVAVTRDIAYAPETGQRLDLYVPERPDAGAPVLVFFHGGGWESGAPGDYRFLGLALARRGVTTVVAGTRLYPAVRYPAFLEDAALAVRWAQDRLAQDKLGGGGRVFLMGHSAGAHIAAMLALDPRWLGAVGLRPERDLAGMIGLSGPYDFLPLRSPTLRAIFGPPETLPATQPIRHVSAAAPPMFLATGCADRVVDPGNTARLAAAQRAAGGAVATRAYPRIGHALTIGAFAGPLRFTAPVLEETLAFLRNPGAAAGTATCPPA